MKSSTLYIVANGNRIRAFHFVENDGLSEDTSHLTELNVSDFLHDVFPLNESSDRPGRFEKGDSIHQRSGLAGGEQHSKTTENKNRAAGLIADAIKKILASNHEAYQAWRLIAPATWETPIVERLKGDCQKSLIKPIQGDWTGLPVSEIQSRLLETT